MNDLNNKFSIIRVRCLFSYYSKQWKESFLYLPLAYLSIGLLHIIHSVLIGNPKSIDNNDLSAFVNVTNFYDKAFGLQIFKVAFLVFLFFQLFSIIIKKEKSTFFRSVPVTAFEKFSFLMLEYLYVLLLVVFIHIFCIFLDGTVCALFGYNEWSDILPAIQSYFTPKLELANDGSVIFVNSMQSANLLEESWMNNKMFVFGVSLNRKIYYSFYLFLFISIISNKKIHIEISEYKNISKWLFASIPIITIVLIIFFSSKIKGMGLLEIIGMSFGYGPWCYNLEYGWMIQTLVLMMWIFLWLKMMYKGIKNGEAK